MAKNKFLQFLFMCQTSILFWFQAELRSDRIAQYYENQDWLSPFLDLDDDSDDDDDVNCNPFVQELMRARGWSDRGQGRARHLSIYNWFLAIHQPALPASYLPFVIDAEVFTNCKTNYKIDYRIRSQYRYVRKQPRSSIQIFAAVIIKKVVLWMIHLLATKNRAILAVMMNHQSSFMIVMMVMWWCWCRWQRWWWWTLEKDQTRSVSQAIDFLPPTAAVLQLQEGITITTTMMMTITITRTMTMTMTMTMINFGERRRRKEGGDMMHLLLIRSALLWKC